VVEIIEKTHSTVVEAGQDFSDAGQTWVAGLERWSPSMLTNQFALKTYIDIKFVVPQELEGIFILYNEIKGLVPFWV
jgi:hypothetical protein